MRVRIKESSFCLRALRTTLASFGMAAARSKLTHVPRASGSILFSEVANRGRLISQSSERTTPMFVAAIEPPAQSHRC